MMKTVKALVAEFIGTFTLIFIGVGVTVRSGNDIVAVALAHGIAIAVMVSALGAISGGHFNPAVSIGAWIAQKINSLTLLLYWVFQILGAVAGAWLIHYCLTGHPGAGGGGGRAALAAPPLDFFGTPHTSEDLNMIQCAVLEGIGAFFLTMVVFGTAIDKRAPKVGGLFIGLAISMSILCFGPETGAAINPARFLGPAIIEHMKADPSVYVIGPLVGGLLAGIIYGYFLAEKETTVPAPEPES